MEYVKNQNEVVISDGDIDLVQQIGENDGNNFFYDIALHDTDVVVGSIEYENSPKQTKYMGNVGYAIFKEYRGHDYAKKALVLLKELLIKYEKSNMIFSITPDNKYSINVVTKFGAVYVCDRQIPKNNVLCKMFNTPKVKIYTYNLKGSKKK